MKYLKRFNEDININISDSPGVKMSKTSLNTLEQQIKDFNQKKPQIDKIYLNTPDDTQLNTKVNQIMGNDKVKNPFLIEYLNIANLKRKLDRAKKSNIDDKLKLDDFKQEQMISQDTNQKTALKQKIDDINKRMSLSNSSIIQITKEINNYEKDLDSKTKQQDKDLKGYIKKISSN